MMTGLNPTSEQLLNSINAAQANLNRAQQQVSSGLRVSRASDDPAVIADILQTRSDLAQVTQVSNNLSLVKSEVDTADTGLQNAVQLMEQAGVLALQGTNTTMTAGARATLAQQVAGILQQMVTISRTQVHGIYIFSGDQTSTPPYELDSTGVKQIATAPATRLIQDTSGLTFAVSKTAQELFDARDSGQNPTAENVFAALQGLKTALLANDPVAIQSAAAAINTAHDYLNDNAGFYGGVQQRVATALDLAQKFETQDQTRLSSEQDADIAAAALQITQDTTHINAAMASAAKQITTSLFDYMR
jgi:flagellar hook-associated protein 3 FlgL